MPSLTTFLSTFFVSILLFIIPLQSITSEAQLERLNVHQFSLLTTNHLLFDYIDGSLNTLTKHISIHFQDIIIKFTVDHDEHHLQDAMVDMDLLKIQLQAAISSFVEDSLPTIWSSRSNTMIDKAYLMDFVENVTSQYCYNPETNHIYHHCVEHNAENILNDVNRHIQYQLDKLLLKVLQTDLSSLFDVTQQYVNRILAHFNHQYQHTITSSSTIDLSILRAQLNTVLYKYLQSIQDQSTFQKLASLCIE